MRKCIPQNKVIDNNTMENTAFVAGRAEHDLIRIQLGRDQTFKARIVFPDAMATHSEAVFMCKPLISGDQARLFTGPLEVNAM